MNDLERAKTLFYEGLKHLQEQDYAQAEGKLLECLKIVPDRVSTLTNLTATLIKLKKLEAAREHCLKAISLEKDSPESWLNLGLIEQESSHHAEAVDCFDTAIRLNPGDADAWFNRGVALQDAMRRQEALASFERALEIRPDFAGAKNRILWLRLKELKNLPLIEKLGVETASLNQKQESEAFRSTQKMSDFRVLHDLEQTGHLLALGYQCEGLREAHVALQDIYSRFHANQGHSRDSLVIPVSAKQVADIDRFRGNAPRYQVPADIEYCLAPDNDWQAIEERYFGSVPEMIYIDNFLSGQALLELRKFCLISSVWRSEYHHQYLGAFSQSGFVSPLHLRIAIELRQRMPRIFAAHELEQVWGYKYTSKMGTGINVHADFAKVNLNFWITPDEANLDPASGGLIVYDVPAPSSWSFEDYNRDEKRIYDFLEENGAGRMKVPYKCNRAVLFNSTLFHETDEIHFKEGYENRRINITYLFGQQLSC
jgi:tetratricopeptide (TPR) repeat protein